MKKRTMVLASLMAVTALLGGCASTGTYGTYSETVYVAPPPPRVEYMGPPPVVGHIWITGYWNWGGGRYVWVPGRWEAPRHGQQWVAPRWERDGDRWRQHGGYWEKSNHVVAPARPAPRQEDRGHFERREMPRQEVRPEPRNDYREPPRAERREMQPPPRVERQEVRPPANEVRRDGWQPRDNRPSPERRDQYTGASPNPPVRAEAPRPPTPAVERSPERRERPQEARNERNDRGDRGERGDASGRGDRQHDRRGRDEARG